MDRSLHGMFRGFLAALTMSLLAVALSSSPAGAQTSYTVQHGDTLSQIALSLNTTVVELVEANDLADEDDIQVGQVLVFSGLSQELITHSQDIASYEVLAGDTIGEIAVRFGVSASALAKNNHISNANSIQVGEILSLSGPSSVNVTAAEPTGSALDGSISSGSSQRSAHGTYSDLPEAIRDDEDRMALLGTFEYWAGRNGIAVDLLMAVAYQESGWQPLVTSHKGAVGIGQLMPRTSHWIATELIGIADLDPTDVDDNIRMSARYLRWLQGVVGSDSRAIAAYYQGPTSIRTIGNYIDTNRYVTSVNALRARFQPDA